MAIQNGSIVWLKTGGPAMTVKFFTTRKEWLCSWFLNDEVREHAFSEEQLTETDPNPQTPSGMMPIAGGGN